MERAKREKRTRWTAYIKGIFVCWVVFAALCMVVPPLFHKSAEDANIVRGGYGGPQERILSIDDNMDALLWRLRLIEAAQSRIVLSTFDFRDDNSGRDIMAALLHAADRGVQVRILIDGFNGVLQLRGSDNFWELASHENVEVRLYNPVSLLKPWKANYRMHDKYLIADDFAYILGGRNTDDLFLGNYVDTCNEDRDILVYETAPGEGRSFLQLEEYFERIWELPCCEPCKKREDAGEYLEDHYRELTERYPDAFLATDWEAATMETEGIELCTNPMGPENKEPLLWSRLVAEMERADNILIQTPYIICDEKMYRDLTELNSGNARTEIVINAVESGTNPFGCTDYLNQRENILETGSCIYEYLGEQALHTKTILAGESTSIVGSCNLDMRSVYLDTEMMLVIESKELNAMLRRQVEGYMEKSRRVLPDGTVTDGAAYVPAEQSRGKEIFYKVLRVLILPFRHLL